MTREKKFIVTGTVRYTSVGEFIFSEQTMEYYLPRRDREKIVTAQVIVPCPYESSNDVEMAMKLALQAAAKLDLERDYNIYVTISDYHLG